MARPAWNTFALITSSLSKKSTSYTSNTVQSSNQNLCILSHLYASKIFASRHIHVRYLTRNNNVTRYTALHISPMLPILLNNPSSQQTAHKLEKPNDHGFFLEGGGEKDTNSAKSVFHSLMGSDIPYLTAMAQDKLSYHTSAIEDTASLNGYTGKFIFYLWKTPRFHTLSVQHLPIP